MDNNFIKYIEKNIFSVPQLYYYINQSLQLYINGELIGGLDIIKEMVESNELQSMIPSKKAANSNAGSLEHRMKELINQAKVMVFMKGNRNEPRCGFSRTLMEILKGKKNESICLDGFNIQEMELEQNLTVSSFYNFRNRS